MRFLGVGCRVIGSSLVVALPLHPASFHMANGGQPYSVDRTQFLAFHSTATTFCPSATACVCTLPPGHVTWTREIAPVKVMT